MLTKAGKAVKGYSSHFKLRLNRRGFFISGFPRAAASRIESSRCSSDILFLYGHDCDAEISHAEKVGVRYVQFSKVINPLCRKALTSPYHRRGHW